MYTKNLAIKEIAKQKKPKHKNNESKKGETKTNQNRKLWFNFFCPIILFCLKNENHFNFRK